MQISIVGCGWLGLPLAQTLQKSGHNIVATTRNQYKCTQFETLGFKGIQYALGDNIHQPAIAPALSSDVLVLNIPFGRKSTANQHF